MAVYSLIVAAVVIQASLSVKPGFKARVTENGLQYANTVVLKALTKMLEDKPLPDVKGPNYSLTGMRINGFQYASGTMRFHEGSGIIWSASGDTLNLHGSFSYKKKIGWIYITDYGSFDTTMSNVAFTLDLSMGNDSHGHPTISTRDCSCRIGSVKITLAGKWAWLYNLFRGIIANVVKNEAIKRFCDVATTIVNKYGNKRLSQIPVEMPLAEKFIWDNELISAPTFQLSYMETLHKGEVFWKGSRAEAPLSPKPLPSGSKSTKMLYLWVSDYVPNTMGYAAHKNGFMTYLISPADLPPSNRSLLNTTCPRSLTCIGNIIPEIGKKYPHSTVKLELKSTKAPVVKINNGNIALTGGCNVFMYAQESGGQEPLMLTVNLNATGTVTASIRKNLLTGRVLNASLKAKIVKSKIGKVDEQHLDDVMNLVLTLAIIPAINERGKAGMFLPVGKMINFVDPSLTLVQDTIVVETDLRYVPNTQKNELEVNNVGSRFGATSHKIALLPPMDPIMIFKEIGRRRRRPSQQL